MNPTESSREYDAVRNHAALFDLSGWAKIRITGKDRIKFLQGLTTNDMNHLSEGKGLYTLLPTVKGKIASEAVVLGLTDHLLLLLDPDLRDTTLKILNKFKIGSDAMIEDVSNGFIFLSLQGPKSDAILADWLGQPLPDLMPLEFRSFVLDGITLQVIRNDRSGEGGADILFPSAGGENLESALLEKGGPSGLLRAGSETYEIVRIENGIPRFGAELSDEILPQEAGLEEKAISYTKGCYIGQETIARLHYLGHTNRSLTGLVFEGDIPARSDKIVDGDREIGWITSAAISPSLRKGIALGFLNRHYINSGTAVEIAHREKRLKGVVTALPFVKPARHGNG